ILARRYDADAFGLYGVYSTACAMLTIAAALCYEQGIVPAKSEAEAGRLTYLALLLVGGLCVGLGLPLVLLGPWLLRLAEAESFTPVILLLPIGIAFNAAVEVLLHWANRNHRDRIMSSAYVTQAGVMVAAQIGASWLAVSQYGLILGQVVGNAMAVALLCCTLPWPALPKDEGGWWRQIRDTARRHAVLPRLGAPQVLLEAGADILVIALLTDLFGTAEVG